MTFLRPILIVIAFFLLDGTAAAQTAGDTKPTKSTESDPPAQTEASEKPALDKLDSEQINKKIEELETRIQVHQSVTDEEKAKTIGASLEEISLRINKIKTLRSAYKRFLTELDKKNQLEKEEDLLDIKLAAPVGRTIGQEPPYMLSFYDGLLDEKEVALQRKTTTSAAVKFAEMATAEAEKRFIQARQALQALKAKIENESSEIVTPEARWKLSGAKIDVELAEITLKSEKENQNQMGYRQIILDLTIQILSRQIEWVASRLQFDEADKENWLKQIADQRTQLTKLQQRLLDEQEEVKAKWLQAETKFADNVYLDKVQLLEEEVKARESWLNTYHIVLEQVGSMLRFLDHKEEVGRQRFELLKGEPERKELIAWKAATDSYINEMTKLVQLQENYQAALQSQIVALEKQLADPDVAPQIKVFLKERLQSNKRRAERRSEFISAILETIQRDQRFNKEINLKIKYGDWLDRLWAFMSKARVMGAIIIVAVAVLIAICVAVITNRFLHALVQRTKFHLDDKIFHTVVRPVWISIIIIGAIAGLRWAAPEPPIGSILEDVLSTVLIILWGFTLLKLFRTVSHDWIMHWRRQGRQGTEIIRLADNLARLIIILGAIFLFLTAWDINITPLLASAGIAGVAVALAAKETLSNFFGGVSVMLDQPFKIGDYIILDSGERGEVVEIGMRSTRILTRDEILIAIPNSVITNSKIINESAPKPRFRVRIKIGVAYGTDIDQMESILLDIANSHVMVVKQPTPRVRFRNFGDSSLNFELLCWSFKPEDKGRLIHALNSEIYKAFNANGIVIPFPQVDLNVNRLPGALPAAES